MVDQRLAASPAPSIPASRSLSHIGRGSCHGWVVGIALESVVSVFYFTLLIAMPATVTLSSKNQIVIPEARTS